MHLSFSVRLCVAHWNECCQLELESITQSLRTQLLRHHVRPLFYAQARLGGEDIGYSFRRDLKLISEVQAPFRGVRRFFSVAFSSAAGISLFFTVPRLIRAIQGGDDAPDLLATAENAAINVGGKRKLLLPMMILRHLTHLDLLIICINFVTGNC